MASDIHEWDCFTHPNGSIYWVYQWSNTTRVVSDTEPPTFVNNTSIIREIQAASRDLRSNNLFYMDLDIYIKENGCSYVEHEHCVSAPAQLNLAHFRARLANSHNLPPSEWLRPQGRYWAYMESHPNHRGLSSSVISEVSAALTWCYADRVLYEASNSPFEKEHSQEMLDLIQNISIMEGVNDSGTPAAVIRVWYCAAVMRTIVYDRLDSHYGDRQAAEIRRRARSDDLPIVIPYSSAFEWLVWHIAGTMAFGLPFGYFKRINNVDRTVIEDGINTIRWRSLLKELCKEWTDSNLLATVLVAGTVALLAIPGIKGLVQITGLLSALCALGSVLAGTFLVSNHQSRIESSSKAALIYFNRAKSLGFGTTRPLAVILSLPIALMLWGMFWFVFAIGSNAYAPGLPGISEKYQFSTRIIILSLLLMFIILGTLVVLFFYKVWVSPTAVPLVGRAERHPTSPPTLIRVKVLPTSSADILPGQPAYVQSLAGNATSSPPQIVEVLSSPPRGQRSPPRRRSTVGFEDSPIVIPSPRMPATRRPRRSSGSTIYVYPSTTPPSSRSQPFDSDVHSPRRAATLDPIQDPSGDSLQTPIRTSRHPPTPPRPSFATIDTTKVAPYAPSVVGGVPGLHVFRRGARVTRTASTGQIALILTTQNEAIWRFLLEDDERFMDLVGDIWATCERYGEIETVSIPRRPVPQIGPEEIGQACVKFTLPEAANRALRGFMDRQLKHCPVSARLLTDEEEAAWEIPRQMPQPTLQTVSEEGTVPEDAASLRAESPEDTVVSPTAEDAADMPITNGDRHSSSLPGAALTSHPAEFSQQVDSVARAENPT